MRRRPKVHSGASAAEQTEWACRAAGAARARGSGAEDQADPPRVPPARDLSLPCTLKGRRAARCRRAVPKTQDPVLRHSPDPRAPAPPRRGPAPRAHLDAAPLAAHAGRHVRGAASLPAELATRAGRQDPLPPVVEVRVLRRAPSAARPAALPGLPQAPRTHVVAVPVLVALAAVAAGEGHTVGVNVQLTHWGAGRVRGPLVAAHRPCPPPARAWVCPSPDLTFLNVWRPVGRDSSTLDPAAGWEPASLRLSRLARLCTQGAALRWPAPTSRPPIPDLRPDRSRGGAARPQIPGPWSGAAREAGGTFAAEARRLQALPAHGAEPALPEPPGAEAVGHRDLGGTERGLSLGPQAPLPLCLGSCHHRPWPLSPPKPC